MNDITVNIIEAARLLGCGRSRIFELIAAGRLRSYKIGRERRILRRDIEKLVEQLVERGLERAEVMQ
jgi:excisionase family DNA binding protein